MEFSFIGIQLLLTKTQHFLNFLLQNLLFKSFYKQVTLIVKNLHELK